MPTLFAVFTRSNMVTEQGSKKPVWNVKADSMTFLWLIRFCFHPIRKSWLSLSKYVRICKYKKHSHSFTYCLTAPRYTRSIQRRLLSQLSLLQNYCGPICWLPLARKLNYLGLRLASSLVAPCISTSSSVLQEAQLYSDSSL